MRYPEGHKEAVRERIVRVTAKALRKEGPLGISIPGLMKKAGLTHGAFYVHFKKRDDLLAAAVNFAADATAEGLFRAAPDLSSALDRYLSAEHVKHPEGGCVVAALGADAPREKASVRKAFHRAAHGLLMLVEEKRGRAKSPSDESIRIACQMVGAVTLARMVDDPALEARILKAARAID